MPRPLPRGRHIEQPVTKTGCPKAWSGHFEEKSVGIFEIADDLVRELRATGVTIILTTHYIDEAEEMADRIGVIDKGRLIVVEEKRKLMKKLGRKQLTLALSQPLAAVPAALSSWPLALADAGNELEYTFEAAQDSRIPELLRELEAAGISYKDLNTKQSSLEDIFVSLVHRDDRNGAKGAAR